MYMHLLPVLTFTTLTCRASIPCVTIGLFKVCYWATSNTYILFARICLKIDPTLQQYLTDICILKRTLWSARAQLVTFKPWQARLTHDNQISRHTDGKLIQIDSATEVCGVDSCWGCDCYIQVEFMVLTLAARNFFSECKAFAFVRFLIESVHNGVVDVPPCIESPGSAEEIRSGVHWHSLVGWIH